MIEKNQVYERIVSPHLSQVEANPNAFISVWDTSQTRYGSSNSTQIRLPLLSGGIYNFSVDWGDGSINNITNANYFSTIHTYNSKGVYVISITGTINGWQFNYDGDKLKLLEIQQWGCLQLGNFGCYFAGCENLKLTTTDELNLTGTTNLGETFALCFNLGNTGNLNTWDVSSVTDMSGMFLYTWNFSNPIGDWEVSCVTDMSGMFKRASSFNQLLGDWDVSNVANMSEMFSYALSFNQPLGDWDVSNVANMSEMFMCASSFNQPLGDWNVSRVIDMSGIFNHVRCFNQSIGNWNVSNVTDMSGMFMCASSFNQPLGDWNVSSVTDMSGMIKYAYSFNQPLGDWDVSSVTDMRFMFHSASSFNQPLGDWNVSNVIDMGNMFQNVTLSIESYDHLLLGWSQLPLQDGVIFDAGNSRCSDKGEVAKQLIIDTYHWQISDGSDKDIPAYSLSLFAIFGLIAIVKIAHKTKHIPLKIK